MFKESKTTAEHPMPQPSPNASDTPGSASQGAEPPHCEQTAKAEPDSQREHSTKGPTRYADSEDNDKPSRYSSPGAKQHLLLIIHMVNFWGFTLPGHPTIVGKQRSIHHLTPRRAHQYHSGSPFRSLLHRFTSSPTIFLSSFFFFRDGVEGRRGRIYFALVLLY